MVSRRTDITQVKFNTTLAQADALTRVARERGVSKGMLIRDAVASVTGVPNGMRQRPSQPNNFAAHNARRSAEAAARRSGKPPPRRGREKP